MSSILDLARKSNKHFFSFQITLFFKMSNPDYWQESIDYLTKTDLKLSKIIQRISESTVFHLVVRL